MRYIGVMAAVVMSAGFAMPVMAQSTSGTTPMTGSSGMSTPGQAPTTNNSHAYGNAHKGSCDENNPAACPPGVNPLTQGTSHPGGGSGGGTGSGSGHN